MTDRAVDDPVQLARAGKIIRSALKRHEAAEMVERTRKEQGLPAKVDDPVVFDKIAKLIESAPRLSAEQVETLRRLLPSPEAGS